VPARAVDAAGSEPAFPRTPLLALALVILVGHHVGTAFGGLGDVGPTRWADWIDMAVPYALLGAAGAVLLRVRADPLAWLTFAVGAVLYAHGHGVHLAANSVGNVEPSDTAHLWDEVVGHYVWYAGFALVLAAVTRALTGTAYRLGAVAYLLAAGVGFTWFTNNVEGGTAVFGIAVAVAFLAWARSLAGVAARLALVVMGTALPLLVIWGVWHQGFPEFTDVGWI